jgi:hypothetical protein
MSKVISLSEAHFERTKQRPLTSLMVTSLLAACAKQREGIEYGPKDIKGSFTALITRGLIIRKQGIVNMQISSIWQVTTEAIDQLKGMGIKVDC